MGVFECQPVAGKRILNITFQPDGDSKVSVAFHGATWSLRKLFDGYALDTLRDEEGTVYRCMQSVDVAAEAKTHRFQDVLTSLKNTVACILVD